MKNKIILFVASIACMLLMMSCSVSPVVEPGVKVKQIDMTVSVPIHRSSLEYFDYVLTYQDNNGEKYTDVVTEGEEDVVTYVRTFSYRELPVMCTMTVEMVPKEGCTSVDAFFFYIPKPYIYPNVYESNASAPDGTDGMDELAPIHVQPMSISEFQDTYGSLFMSACGVYPTDEGYKIINY